MRSLGSAAKSGMQQTVAHGKRGMAEASKGLTKSAGASAKAKPVKGLETHHAPRSKSSDVLSEPKRGLRHESMKLLAKSSDAVLAARYALLDMNDSTKLQRKQEGMLAKAADYLEEKGVSVEVKAMEEKAWVGADGEGLVNDDLMPGAGYKAELGVVKGKFAKELGERVTFGASLKLSTVVLKAGVDAEDPLSSPASGDVLVVEASAEATVKRGKSEGQHGAVQIGGKAGQMSMPVPKGRMALIDNTTGSGLEVILEGTFIKVAKLPVDQAYLDRVESVLKEITPIREDVADTVAELNDVMPGGDQSPQGGDLEHLLTAPIMEKELQEHNEATGSDFKKPLSLGEVDYHQKEIEEKAARKATKTEEK